jgi:hypothetical protein
MKSKIFEVTLHSDGEVDFNVIVEAGDISTAIAKAEMEWPNKEVVLAIKRSNTGTILK